MKPVRSALYLDFDNVFSGLLKLDPSVALSFAEAPGEWLSRLAVEAGAPRRWLVLRCYINPAGSVPDPRGEGTRLNFFRFRSAFTDAGFEVIDCPRLSHTKNGADIRLVIDAVEALRADARYDEFVIASGDSDMTPLLVRLRADDRQVTLISPSDSAVIMQAVADRLIGGDDLLDLLDTRAEVLDDDLNDDDASVGDGAFSQAALTETEARDRFVSLVSHRYATAQEPIVLSTLAHELRAELGPITKTSKWFGHGGFVRAIQGVDLPGVRMSQLHLWDGTRSSAPETQVRDEMENLAEAVGRVSKGLKVPTLPSESWVGIYDALATFARTYEFNLSEANRWSRDRVADGGLRVNRLAVGLVARGAAFGGRPLYNKPSKDEIAQAFVDNLLNRAAATDIELSRAEVELVRRWFGAPDAAGWAASEADRATTKTTP